MNIIHHFPVLIIIFPFSAALLSPFFSRIQRSLGKYLVTISLFLSFICSVGVLICVMKAPEQTIRYWMGNWRPPIGIEFYIDPLNAVLTMFITILALCCALFSAAFFKDKEWLQTGGFYSLLGLLNVGLCGMTLTGDVFNLYVFLELASLSCYGLVALGGKHSVRAAFRYLLIGTIGASFYLLAVGFLYALTGTLNMADMSVLIQNQSTSPLLLLACACLITCFGIKMAIFPFHIWQPDAYSSAHPGAAPLISGAMGKVPAFALIRFFFFLLGVDHIITLDTVEVAGIIGAIGIIFGSVIALRQTDFRRMLAYSSIAQLGYIALGIGIGNLYGVTGSFLHILNHLLMKGGLFFVIGAIQFRYGIVDIRKFGQLHKRMPFTCFTLVIASMSMIGIPPTGGFFSKWYLLLGCLNQKLYVYIAVLIISSLLNAVYFIRVLEYVFISPPGKRTDRYRKNTLELPLGMLLPIILFGAGIIAVGILNSGIVTDMIKNTLQGVALL